MNRLVFSYNIGGNINQKLYDVFWTMILSIQYSFEVEVSFADPGKKVHEATVLARCPRKLGRIAKAIRSVIENVASKYHCKTQESASLAAQQTSADELHYSLVIVKAPKE